MYNMYQVFRVNEVAIRGRMGGEGRVSGGEVAWYRDRRLVPDLRDSV